ncbi:MAG: hypothetical protein ABIH23_14060 [bacterium]
MDVSLYTARIQADVLKVRDDLEAAYDRHADATFFWAFVDLAGSSNYRIAHGPKDGYIRAEAFFALVRTVIAPYSEIRLIKEIGDEVFLSAPSFRPLFESLLLIGETAHHLALVVGTETYPFDVRGGIGFGAAKRLMRPHEDFVGSPIDQLARIMAVRSERSDLLIHEEAYRPSEEILKEYKQFVAPGESRMIPENLLKGMKSPVYYREVLVDRQALGRFRDHFDPWKKRQEP